MNSITLIIEEPKKGKREEIFINRSIISIGRNEINDVIVGKHEDIISRFHAAIIENEHGKYFIRDLGSKNGIYVNNKRIFRKILKDGDIVYLGPPSKGYKLEFKLGSKASQIIKPVKPIMIEDKSTSETILIDRSETILIERFKEPLPKEWNEFISILDGITKPSSFFTHLLAGLVRALQGRRGFYAEIEDDGYIPKYYKNIDIYSTPPISVEMFKKLKANKESVKYALKRDDSIDKTTIALAIPFKTKCEFGFFYIEIPEDIYKEENKEIAITLVNESKKFFPEEEFQEETNVFKWKENFVGNRRTPSMREVYEKIEKTAKDNRNLLILGETGAGKEETVKKIYKLSNKKGELRAVNCHDVPETLLQDRLFGHEKGAFAEAKEPRPGEFENAKNGILFIDEIATLTPSMQVMLLRVLETKEFQRLGANAPIRKLENVKIITATNEDLQKKIDEGKFREDFYGKISEDIINLPPLRKRKEDIPLLTAFFIDNLSRTIQGITREAIDFLMQYDWKKKNIRELKHVIEGAIANAEYENREIILKEDLKLSEEKSKEEKSKEEDELKKLERILIKRNITLKELKKIAITASLKRNNGNINKSCEELGISRPTFYNLCKEIGIDPEKYRIKVKKLKEG